MIHLDRSWRRPAPTAAQVRHDAGFAVLAALAGVVSVELYRSAFDLGLGWRGVEAYGWFALAGLALAGRRRFPLSTLLAEAAIFIVVGERLGQIGATFTIQMIMFGTIYAAWAWSRRTRALLAVTAVVLVAMFGWLVWALLFRDQLTPGKVGLLPAATAQFVYSVIINIAYFFGAIGWGHVAWRSARQRAELAEQHARERDRQEEHRSQAVRDERVRIARDLHDVVAHDVSGIGVVAAGAGRVLERDPAAARSSLARIERSSRDAVTQMHQLVGLLRESDDGDRSGGRAPSPGVRDVLALRPGGRIAVDHREVGSAFPVPETVGVSLYRIAQEAVTNVRRHADAHRATVVLRYVEATDAAPRAVEVEVIDDGAGRRTRPATEPNGVDDKGGLAGGFRGGFGHTGIRERAAMHGGEAEIGPRPNGGYRVRVRIPVAEVDA